jgi:coronin-7
LQSGDCHQGVKPSRVLWLGKLNVIATTGFSKMRERQLGIWDPSNLSKSLVMTILDSSTGVIDLHYDNDINFLYLVGKGDATVRVYEMSDKDPVYTLVSTVQSDAIQKASCTVPKRALDLMDTEVTRILKLSPNAAIPINFTVPRKVIYVTFLMFFLVQVRIPRRVISTYSRNCCRTSIPFLQIFTLYRKPMNGQKELTKNQF